MGGGGLEARDGFKNVRVGGGSTKLKEMENSFIKMKVIRFCGIIILVGRKK